jgi:hypothetical protein
VKVKCSDAPGEAAKSMCHTKPRCRPPESRCGDDAVEDAAVSPLHLRPASCWIRRANASQQGHFVDTTSRDQPASQSGASQRRGYGLARTGLGNCDYAPVAFSPWPIAPAPARPIASHRIASYRIASPPPWPVVPFSAPSTWRCIAPIAPSAPRLRPH